MIREFWLLLGKYRRLSVVVPMLVITGEVFVLSLPLLMARMIDDGINAGNQQQVWWYGSFLIGATLMAFMLAALAGVLGARVAAGFAKNLREQMFARIQEFSFSSLDKFTPASLVTRLTTDVTMVQNSFGMLIRMAVRAPAALVMALFLTVMLSPKLAVIFIIVTPIMIVGFYLIISHAHPIFAKLLKIYDQLNLVVEENLRGIRVVKTFVREKYEQKKFHRVSLQAMKCWSQAERLTAFMSPLMQFCIDVSILFLAYFGARLIVGGEFSVGGLVSLITYSMQILMSLMMIAMVSVMLVMSRASAQRIMEVLKEEITIRSPEKASKCLADGRVEFQDVSFSYANQKNKLALKAIRLKIASGQMVGIIGGTGSGKSTLVSLIPRLFDITSGSVRVGDQDVRNYHLAALREQVACVLQKNVLFSGAIKDNLRWGNADATHSQLVSACKTACAHEFISKLPAGYDELVEQGGTNFSGGQKQRLCLARALVGRPKILILDDATSSVDTRTEAAINLALAKSLPETTKIIIAQRVLSIMHADQIVVLDGGRVVAVGSHQKLLRDCKIYQEMYHSQQRKESSRA